MHPRLLTKTTRLGASNSCINPILYTFFNRKYKHGFAGLLRYGVCCKLGPTGSLEASSVQHAYATQTHTHTQLQSMAGVSHSQSQIHSAQVNSTATTSAATTVIANSPIKAANGELATKRRSGQAPACSARRADSSAHRHTPPGGPSLPAPCAYDHSGSPADSPGGGSSWLGRKRKRTPCDSARDSASSVSGSSSRSASPLSQLQGPGTASHLAAVQADKPDELDQEQTSPECDRVDLNLDGQLESSQV